MNVILISLGGSLIVPDYVDLGFLHEFKGVLRKHYEKYRFVVVCGGGAIARKYIGMLKNEGKSEKELSLTGIMATRMNARFLMHLFGK